MSVLKHLFAATDSLTDLENPRAWLVDFAQGKRSSSGEHVSPQTSLGLPAYFAGLRVIAEDVAKREIEVRQTISQTRYRVLPDHPVAKLLNLEFNPEVTAMAGREVLTHHAAGWGGGLAEVERDGAGTPIRLWPIHPSRIKIERDDDDVMFFRIYNDMGFEPTDLSMADVIHIHGVGSDGTNGFNLSMIQAHALGLGLASQKLASSFFGNGAHLGHILQSPPGASETSKKNVRESWIKAHQGASKAGGFAMLEDGWEYKTIGIPPEQAQFIESRQFSVEEMARILRVNPNKIQHLLRMTFNNVQELNIDHHADTILPWDVRWEQEINRKLFTPQEQANGFHIKHTFMARLRASLGQLAEFNNVNFMNGTFTHNDILKSYGMNDIGPEGDIHWLPLNMVPLDRAIAEPEQIDQEPTTNPPRPPSSPGEEKPSATAIREAQMPVFMDCAERVTRKETDRVKRANKKYKGEAFTNWLGEFYADHRHDVNIAFRNAVHSVRSLLESTNNGALSDELDPVITVLPIATNQYIQQAHSARCNAEDPPSAEDLAALILDRTIQGVLAGLAETWEAEDADTTAQ